MYSSNGRFFIASYLTANELGKTISVTANYTDLQNTAETQASLPTNIVTAPTIPKGLHLSGFENFADSLSGAAGNDALEGFIGNDVLNWRRWQ